MSKHIFCAWLAILILCVSSGCQQTMPPASPEIRNYVLAVDSDGIAGDPVIQTQTARANPSYDLDAQLDGMFAAMDAEHARISERRRGTTAPVGAAAGSPSAATQPAVRKVIIFVHGGLNEPAEALTRAVLEHHEIADSDAGAYSIFINWNSGFHSSYGEHLVDVRRGRNDHKDVIAGPLISPLVLFADFAMAVGRAPLLWVYQVERDLQGGASDVALLAQQDDVAEPWLRHPRHEDVVRMTRALQQKFQADPAHEIQISTGDEHVNSGELTWRAIRYFATLPLKFLTSPLLDGAGTPAWDNMSRRTQIMFEGSSLNDSPGSKDPQRVLGHPPGAVQHFAERLGAHIEQDKGKFAYEITLIGHSMGSMVLNEFVRRNPRLPYANIVYLAPACTVRDFSTSVVPLMRRNRSVRFYNLCLDPTAELRETHGYEIPPRGSLLVWIDDYFANPATPLDRTLGRWENIVESTYVIPDDPQIRKRITLKAFALNPTDAFDPNNPQQHGHFRYLRYWDESLWKATPNPEMIKAIARHADRIEQAQRRRAPRAKPRAAPVQRYQVPTTAPAPSTDATE